MFKFNHFNFNILDLQKSLDFYKKALGLTVEENKFSEYWTRLDHLRAGEVGEKILAGIGQVMVDGWEA